jgi:hypothetical protein
MAIMSNESAAANSLSISARACCSGGANGEVEWGRGPSPGVVRRDALRGIVHGGRDPSARVQTPHADAHKTNGPRIAA